MKSRGIGQTSLFNPWTKGAFDNVPHDILIRKIKSKNILTPTKFTLLKFLLEDTYIQIEGPEHKETFRANTGVPQPRLTS